LVVDSIEVVVCKKILQDSSILVTSRTVSPMSRVAVEIAAEDERSKFIQVIEKLLVQENICQSFPLRR